MPLKKWLLAIGDVLEIEGRQYVLTTARQITARRIDRNTEGAAIDDVMNSHPDYRFVEVIPDASE